MIPAYDWRHAGSRPQTPRRRCRINAKQTEIRHEIHNYVVDFATARGKFELSPGAPTSKGIIAHTSAVCSEKPRVGTRTDHSQNNWPRPKFIWGANRDRSFPGKLGAGNGKGNSRECARLLWKLWVCTAEWRQLDWFNRNHRDCNHYSSCLISSFLLSLLRAWNFLRISCRTQRIWLQNLKAECR